MAYKTGFYCCCVSLLQTVQKKFANRKAAILQHNNAMDPKRNEFAV